MAEGAGLCFRCHPSELLLVSFSGWSCGACRLDASDIIVLSSFSGYLCSNFSSSCGTCSRQRSYPIGLVSREKSAVSMITRSTDWKVLLHFRAFRSAEKVLACRRSLGDAKAAAWPNIYLVTKQLVAKFNF